MQLAKKCAVSQLPVDWECWVCWSGIRNGEENVDWECGSLAIACASGGMMWFGGCEVPTPFPANRFLPLSFLKKNRSLRRRLGTVHLSKVMINETRRDFSPNNPPYLLTAMSLNLQMTLTSVDVSLWPFSSTLSSHGAQFRWRPVGGSDRRVFRFSFSKWLKQLTLPGSGLGLSWLLGPSPPTVLTIKGTPFSFFPFSWCMQTFCQQIQKWTNILPTAMARNCCTAPFEVPFGTLGLKHLEMTKIWSEFLLLVEISYVRFMGEVHPDLTLNVWSIHAAQSTLIWNCFTNQSMNLLWIKRSVNSSSCGPRKWNWSLITTYYMTKRSKEGLTSTNPFDK